MRSVLHARQASSTASPLAKGKNASDAITALPSLRARLAVATAPETVGFTDQETATIVDLTEPAIRPETIDLSSVKAGTGWVVLLPSEAAPVESGACTRLWTVLAIEACAAAVDRLPALRPAR